MPSLAQFANVSLGESAAVYMQLPSYPQANLFAEPTIYQSTVARVFEDLIPTRVVYLPAHLPLTTPPAHHIVRGRADSGDQTATQWITITEFVTLPQGSSAATATITPTPPPNVSGGTLTVTVFVTQPPGVVPISTPAFDSLTITATELVTAATATVIEYPTSTRLRPSPTPQRTPGVPEYSGPCRPGDQFDRVDGTIKPTHTQTVTMIVLVLYLITGLIVWNFVVLRDLIYPVKLCVTAWHEMGHAILAAFGGGMLERFVPDPVQGGVISINVGGQEVYPIAALPGGYILNILIGCALVYAGFDTLAAKGASIFLGLNFIGLLNFANGLGKLLMLGALGLMIGLWFIDHGSALRYFVLYFGGISTMFVIFDVTDDLIFHKFNASCPRLHYQANPRTPPSTFAAIYTGVSLVVLALVVIAALGTFRSTPHGMYCRSQTFLPT